MRAQSERCRPTRPPTEVEFVKLSPTQNMTVLVTSPHATADYRSIAAQLLSAGHVHAEQVGFVGVATSPAAQVRLHMAGGEFCGNACMAAAALTSEDLGRTTPAPVDVIIEVSGSDVPLTCRVERRDHGFECELTMPRPNLIEPYSCPLPFESTRGGRSALIHYPDAAHLVVECEQHDEGVRAWAETVAAQLGVSEDVSVVGVMLYSPTRRELTPLVSVPALASVVWERSCGSGTASLGAYLAATTRAHVSTSIRQPGGTMHVWAHACDGAGSGYVVDLRIGGRVLVVAEGTAYVHD